MNYYRSAQNAVRAIAIVGLVVLFPIGARGQIMGYQGRSNGPALAGPVSMAPVAHLLSNSGMSAGRRVWAAPANIPGWAGGWRGQAAYPSWAPIRRMAYPQEQPAVRMYVPDARPAINPLPVPIRARAQNGVSPPTKVTLRATWTELPRATRYEGPSPNTVVDCNGGANCLGGYYFGNYCSGYSGACTFPSAYCFYTGLPGYIYVSGPTLAVYSPPAPCEYVGNYIPFYSATDLGNDQIQSLYGSNDQATTQNPWLDKDATVAPGPAPEPSDKTAQLDQGGTAPASTPVYEPGSYKEAFADIETAWSQGNLDLIRKHLRDNDVKIAISLDGKYSYSISTADWADITRDALADLQTTSFQFTVLRFQKSGDITGYAAHVYANSSKPSEASQTMYAAYTLRHRNGIWYIVAVDTSQKPLIPEQASSDKAGD